MYEQNPAPTPETITTLFTGMHFTEWVVLSREINSTCEDNTDSLELAAVSCMIELDLRLT